MPVMLGDARSRSEWPTGCWTTGVYVIGFSFPVVPEGQGAHPHADVGGARRRDDIDRASPPSPRSGGNSESSEARSMKALVKAEADRASGWRTSPMPEIGPNDVLIKVEQDGDLRHRHPHLQLGRVGADDHPGADGRSATSSAARSSRSAARCAASRSASASRARATSPAAIAATAAPAGATSCRNTRGHRRQPARRVRRVSVAFPPFNVVPLPDDIDDEIGAFLDPLGNAVHTALSFDLVGEDVLITGAGPIGIMAAAIARHVGARHVVVTDVNDYRLELAAKMGATRAVNVTDETLDESMKRARHDRGLRRRPRDVRQRRGASRRCSSTMNHGGRVAHARHPARARSRSTGTRSSSRA